MSNEIQDALNELYESLEEFRDRADRIGGAMEVDRDELLMYAKAVYADTAWLVEKLRGG